MINRTLSRSRARRICLSGNQVTVRARESVISRSGHVLGAEREQGLRSPIYVMFAGSSSGCRL